MKRRANPRFGSRAARMYALTTMDFTRPLGGNP